VEDAVVEDDCAVVELELELADVGLADEDGLVVATLDEEEVISLETLVLVDDVVDGELVVGRELEAVDDELEEDVVVVVCVDEVSLTPFCLFANSTKLCTASPSCGWTLFKAALLP
jgi:hypothetical protein